MRVRYIAKVLMLDGIGGGYRNKAENTSSKMEFTVMRTWAIPPSLFLMTLKASRIACKKSFYLLFLYFVIVFVCVCHCHHQTRIKCWSAGGTLRAKQGPCEPEGARERAPESQRGCTYIFSMPQHCFVAKRLNTALFCRETLKYGTFVAKKWIPC